MDDENPYDTIDYPTMRNMPETVHHDPVYSPARQGSAARALQALIVRNPQPSARAAEHHRPVRGRRCPRASFPKRVDGGGAATGRPYAPMTLCRMLERARVLTLEIPRRVEARAPKEVWRTWRFARPWIRCVRDSRGVGLRAEYLAGKSFRAVVLGSDGGALRRGVRGGYGSP